MMRCPLGERAHPRGSGEHWWSSCGACSPTGSSPRERGALLRPAAVGEPGGLIPAGAGSTRPCQTSTARRPAHPRGSGEHPGGDGRTKSREGSSPRERGALPGHHGAPFRPGLIPAGAGSTPQRCGSAPGTGAHPRGSGEHLRDAWSGAQLSGSSPRERGAPSQHRPTHRPFVRAHPRGSGEHPKLRAPTSCPKGSSPRERGAQVDDDGPVLVDGLIPAGAGSTRSPKSTLISDEAHPRGSGEHEGYVSLLHGRRGSSPRERGAPGTARLHPRPAGLIPAGAGSTLLRPASPLCIRAHPRGSGEHLRSCRRLLGGTGSSPRERGAHRSAPQQHSALGLIPAGAGSTQRPPPVSRRSWAHPRGSGEHRAVHPRSLLAMGSSPRERGALGFGAVGLIGIRLIPAGAGST